MPLNPYFNFQTATNEQNLVEDLIIEAIQIYGMDIIYVPKTLVDYNQLLGEDPMRAFRSFYTVEAYFDNVDGWMGDKNILNKMGLNIDKEAKFSVAKRRFDQVAHPTINWQGSWINPMTYAINDGVDYNGKLYKNLTGTNPNTTPDATPSVWALVPQLRPNEGDLIYLPLTHDIFEISFADHEEVFYQLGKIYVWKITCEKWRYSHEEVNTGNTDIDQIAAQLESHSGDNDPLSDNTAIQTKIQDFLDLDSKSPF